jgi:hypothetical protein
MAGPETVRKLFAAYRKLVEADIKYGYWDPQAAFGPQMYLGDTSMPGIDGLHSLR